MASYLDVVTARTADLQARRNMVDLGTPHRRAAVVLVWALGGGWSATRGNRSRTDDKLVGAGAALRLVAQCGDQEAKCRR